MIAKDFQMNRTKMMHLINFASVTCFIKVLLDELKSCDCYSISFDECLNKTTQTYQMDSPVHDLTKSENQKRACYLDSKLMDHATVNSLLINFIGVIDNVDDGSHIIQVSMDGPSTNWKFFEMLQKDRIEKQQDELNNIRLCILHIIDDAFNIGAESSRWNIKIIFKGVFIILHDTSARRGG